MSGPTILLVDDDPIVCAVVGEVLAMEGYTVRTEQVSTRVIARIQAERPAVVVLDVLMPGFTAPELLSHLARQPYQPPVILHTGTLDPDLALTPSGDAFLAQMARLGAVAAVPKGIELNRLIAAVAAAVGGV